MASRRPTSLKASEPTLRTVVKPASRVRCAFGTVSTDQNRSLNCRPVYPPYAGSESRCTCMSIRPGSRDMPARSMRVAPGLALTGLPPPATCTMRPPRTSTLGLSTHLPVRTSSNLLAVTTSSAGAGAGVKARVCDIAVLVAIRLARPNRAVDRMRKTGGWVMGRALGSNPDYTGRVRRAPHRSATATTPRRRRRAQEVRHACHFRRCGPLPARGSRRPGARWTAGAPRSK